MSRSCDEFIRAPGSVVGAPPYAAKDALMHAMLLRGDRDSQQRLCDRLLNWAGDGGPHFRVVGSHVLLTAIYARTMGSLDPVEREYGVMEEIDIGFWTLVMARKAGGIFDRRLLWMPSFLFVDTAAAMAAGREVFGYPKTASRIEHTGSDDADPGVIVNTLHFPEFGSDERPQREDIVTIASQGPAPAATDISNADELESRLGDALGLDDEEDFVGPISLPNFGMPQVMLRQMRDATGPDNAVLKELLVVTPQPGKFHGAGILAGGQVVTIAKSASHDLLTNLGVEEENSAMGGSWLKFDFTVGWAERLVAAGCRCQS